MMVPRVLTAGGFRCGVLVFFNYPKFLRKTLWGFFGMFLNDLDFFLFGGFVEHIDELRSGLVPREFFVFEEWLLNPELIVLMCL